MFKYVKVFLLGILFILKNAEVYSKHYPDSCNSYIYNYYQEAQCLESKRALVDQELANISQQKIRIQHAQQLQESTQRWMAYVEAECDFYGINDYDENYLPTYEACKLNESKERLTLLRKSFAHDLCQNSLSSEAMADCLTKELQKANEMLRQYYNKAKASMDEYDNLIIDNKLKHAEDLWRLYIHSECNYIAHLENQKDTKTNYQACLINKTNKRVSALKYFIKEKH